jgi:hypothetical protein
MIFQPKDSKKRIKISKKNCNGKCKKIKIYDCREYVIIFNSEVALVETFRRSVERCVRRAVTARFLQDYILKIEKHSKK